MLRGAIFDMDGTLVDSMPLWESLAEIYLNTKGLTPEPGLIDKLWTKSLRESAEYFQAHYGITDDVETIMDDAVKAVEEIYKTSVPLKPGVREFLDQMALRSIPMVICSTGYPALIEPTLERLDIKKYFAEVFTCVELDTTKREPLIYYAAAGFFGLYENEVAVFEDVLHAATTAKNAGFLTIGVEDAASERDKAEIMALSDYYVTDWSDLEGFWTWANTL